ncbi:MAG: SPOR domain-containing protein [Oleiphilaceae bacterium]|nr:SPOR domain-containing protein [Oleiphilaceae bacterium]
MTDHSVDGLKQRLIGAFVILSLAVIFLPMIFDKPHHAVTSQMVELPPKPEIKKVEVTQASQPKFEELRVDPVDQKLKPESQIKSKPIPVVERESSVTEEAPAKKNAKPLETPKVSDLPVFKNIWMVQLGTFSNAANAYKLRDRLREDGFDGHTRKVDVQGKPAIKVFTGPFVNKREAERIKKRVDEKYKVDSLLVFFDA